MLVDRTPQRVRFATQRDEHLVEVPRANRFASRRFYPVSKALPNLWHQHRIVSYVTVTLRSKSSIDVAQAQLEAEYQRTAWLMNAAGNR
jgi:hypothetical protein